MLWKFRLKKKVIHNIVGKFHQQDNKLSQSDLFQEINSLVIYSNNKVKYFPHNHKLMTKTENYGKETFMIGDSVVLESAPDIKLNMVFVLVENCREIEEVELMSMVI